MRNAAHNIYIFVLPVTGALVMIRSFGEIKSRSARPEPLVVSVHEG
jgi:hypothetical protein